MSDERQTCRSCASVLSEFSLFDALKSEAGVDISQTAQEFYSAVDHGCLICSAIHEMACAADYSETAASTSAAFRCRPSSRSNGSSRLIKNIQVETTRPDSNDLKSVRVAIWSAENRYNFDRNFHVEAQEHDLAAEYISTRPINPDVTSPASYDIAREWIRDCLLNHEECPRPDPSFIPTYLIDVGKEDGEESVDVHLTSGQKAPYAALSYCWGGPQPITLTSLTMNDMLQCIATFTLPQTIQDAITVTRKLGLQYLWVDALCIIQDSAADKDAEIAKMDRIYQNAQLTVSAASAERCQDGFLATRSSGVEFLPSSGFASIPFACPDGRSGTVRLREDESYYPSVEPLNRRAWALQERVLSSRVLIYGLWQMYWQCQSQHHCDGGSSDYFSSNIAGVSVLNSLQVQDTNQRGEISVGTENALWTCWKDLVEDYTQRGLTVPSDKLPALSGIATRYQKATNDIYCAGLWKASLLKGLKWQVADPKNDRPSIYRAPSWSWASVFGQSIWVEEFKPPAEHRVAKFTAILECSITPENTLAPFGKVREGTLTIRGVSKPLEWDGAEQIPRADIDPATMPVSAKGIGSPLFPDGIVALIKPDIAEEILYVGNDSVDQNMWEDVIFYMGRDQEGVNQIKRPVVFVVLDEISALVLEEVGDGPFIRLGLMEFHDEEKLEQYFDGCEEKTFIIQ